MKVKGIKVSIIPCHTCDIFIKANQAIFTDNGGGILLSLEKELKEKAKEAPEFMSITDLPDEIQVLLNNYTFKTDARGNEALFLYLRTKDNKMITQKYTQTSYNEIFDLIKKAGGSEHLKVMLTTWKKEIVGRMQKPRLVPRPTKAEKQ